MADGLTLPGVDKTDPTPKYLQARQILIDAIRTGKLPAGGKLPSTKEISTLVDVSLVTAHKALDALVQAGWLRREVGRGTYVREDVDPSVRAQDQLYIGIILTQQVNIDDYYHSTIIEGLRRAARDNGHRVEFFFHDRFSLKDKQKGRVGAICIHPYLESQAEVERLARRYPVVVLGGGFPGGQVTSVDCDNASGAAEAVRHLLGLGHRRFLVLSGPMNLSNARDRARGAGAELAANGIQLDARDQLVSQDSVVLDEHTQTALRARLAGAERPTALVVGGFYLALAAMQVARSVGLSIPGDVSIVGFDDPVSAQLLHPPLTTVAQPLKEMAGQACRLLRDAIIHGPMEVQAHVLPAGLVIRGSTGAARSG